MDPLTIGLQAVGIGMQIFGAAGASSNARQAAQINQGIASDEENINEQKRQQMEMSARRMQLQTMRNTQQAGAQALAGATNQGAQFGSGLQGGEAQVQSEGTFNLFGVNRNLQIGENIFDQNKDISEKKKQLASVQASQATDQSLMSLGGSMVSNAGTIGNIGKYVGGGISDYSSLMGGGSLSGGRGNT